jgi:voltage-gated potassium channel Kch
MNTALNTTAAPGMTIRRKIFAQLFDPDIKDNLRPRFERLIITLILLNIVALIFENVPEIYQLYRGWFHVFDIFSVAAFSLEYLLRLYVAPEDREFASARFPRLRYMFSFFALVDLASIAPFYAGFFIKSADLRGLRVLRLFKLFRPVIPAWKEFRELNQGRSFRQHIYALVTPGERGGKLHTMFDSLIVNWVLISVVAVVLESVNSVHRVLSLEFIVLDAVAVGIFTTEYMMRMYSCVENPRYKHWLAGRYRYGKQPLALIDILSILPFFLEALLHHIFDLRFLRVFRLMRLLKLTRYTDATTTLYRAMVREWPLIASSAFIMLLMVILAASLGYLFEHEAQPDKFENIPQSIYWSVVTLASVGYGDISPVTPMGRMMTVVMALMGIGIFAVPAAVLSSSFNDQIRSDREALQTELFKMLADGKISHEEQEIINIQAARLKLSAEEVDRIMAKALHERELDNQRQLAAFQEELYEMLADGHISAEEQVFIDAQVTRLNLSSKELKRIKDRAQRERHMGGQLPLQLLKEHPQVALEQYRLLVAQMHQLIELSNHQQMTDLLAARGTGSEAELRLWQQLTTPPQATTR